MHLCAFSPESTFLVVLQKLFGLLYILVCHQLFHFVSVFQWEMNLLQQNSWHHTISLSYLVKHFYMTVFYCMSKWSIMDNPI